MTMVHLTQRYRPDRSGGGGWGDGDGGSKSAWTDCLTEYITHKIPLMQCFLEKYVSKCCHNSANFKVFC